jgi:DNA polymerase-3 subunit gamma/tau
VKFVFATTEYHKIPETILSRCQQYDFRMIPAREVQAHLRRIADAEGILVTDDSLARIARAAEGSARDALSLFDQVLSFSGREIKDDDLTALLGLIDHELLLTVSRAILAGDSLALLDLVERLADYGADYRNFARELLLHFREVLLVRLAPPESALLASLSAEERERLRPIAEAFAEEDVLRMIDVLTAAEAELRWAQDPRVTLELALLKLVQLRRLLPFQELVDRVERMAAGVPDVPAAPSARVTLPPPPSVPRAAAAAPPVSAPRPAPAPAPAAPAPSAASPTPPPAAPVVAPAAVGDGAEALLAAMVQAVQSRPSLLQPLRSAGCRLEGDTLVLETAAEWSAFASMHVDDYREVLVKAAGRSLKVRLVEGGGAPAPEPALASAPAPSTDEVKRDRLLKEAQREPAVQEALDLFDGRLVDVREAKPGP